MSDCDHDLIFWSKKNCSEEQFHKAVLLGSKQIKKSISPGNYSAAMWVFISAQSAQSLDRVLLASVLVKRIRVKTDKSGTKHIGGLVAVVYDSYNPMDPARLLCPWDFPGKNIGMGCHFLLQGSFQPRDWTQGSTLHCRQILYQLSYQGIPLYIFNRKNNAEHRWSIYKWSTMQHNEILFNTSKYPLFKTLNMIEDNKEIKLF